MANFKLSIPIVYCEYIDIQYVFAITDYWAPTPPFLIQQV